MKEAAKNTTKIKTPSKFDLLRSDLKGVKKTCAGLGEQILLLKRQQRSLYDYIAQGLRLRNRFIYSTAIASPVITISMWYVIRYIITLL